MSISFQHASYHPHVLCSVPSHCSLASSRSHWTKEKTANSLRTKLSILPLDVTRVPTAIGRHVCVRAYIHKERVRTRLLVVADQIALRDPKKRRELAARLQRASHAALVRSVVAADGRVHRQPKLGPDTDLTSVYESATVRQGGTCNNFHVCACTHKVVLLALSVYGRLCDGNGVGDGLGGCGGCAWRRRYFDIDNGQGADRRRSRCRQERRRSLQGSRLGDRISLCGRCNGRRRLCRFH